MLEHVRELVCYYSPRVLIAIFCSAPANGDQMKIWTCYSGLAAQTWYYTNDNRISLQNAGTHPHNPVLMYRVTDLRSIQGSALISPMARRRMARSCSSGLAQLETLIKSGRSKICGKLCHERFECGCWPRHTVRNITGHEQGEIYNVIY